MNIYISAKISVLDWKKRVQLDFFRFVKMFHFPSKKLLQFLKQMKKIESPRWGLSPLEVVLRVVDGVKTGLGHYHYLGLRVKSLWDLAPPHVTYLGHLRQSVSSVWSAWEWIIGGWQVVLQSQIRWDIFSGHRSGSMKGSCERRISSTHFYLSGNLCNYQVGLSFKN